MKTTRYFVFGALLAALSPALFAIPFVEARAMASDAGATATVDAGTATSADDDDDRADAKDEKPEHRLKRRAYIRRTKKAAADAVHANGKAMTEEERAAIRKHWRISMRLWRIRHLAETTKDTASVAKVDALLAKADAKLVASLKELNAKAPAAAGATGAK